MDALAFAKSCGESIASGDCLSCDVELALHQSGYPALRRLRCEFHCGTVTLHGNVGSYFLKQMAQAVAARVEGVVCIDNRLRVQEASFFAIA